MKLWSMLSNAFAGWNMILADDTGWRERFALTYPGMIAALVIFVVTTFAAVVLASMSMGMPGLFGMVAGMFALALPLTAFVVVLIGTRMTVKSSVPMFDMLVPGLYALTAFVIVEGFLAMIGGPVVMLSWLAMGYLLFKLARVVAGWSLGIAVGFAVLTILLLVAMRLALYMLSNPAGSPI